MSAYSNGDGTTPAATRPEIVMRGVPASVAVSQAIDDVSHAPVHAHGPEVRHEVPPLAVGSVATKQYWTSYDEMALPSRLSTGFVHLIDAAHAVVLAVCIAKVESLTGSGSWSDVV